MTDSDRAALPRTIHDAHSQELLRYVLRLTHGDKAFAEDVVQESLLRLWKRPELLQQCAGGVRAWLYTVARNQVIDEIGPACVKWTLSDSLMSLSADHRAAVFCAYYLGQTVAEIAAHEQIPEGTVKSRMHYALRAIGRRDHAIEVPSAHGIRPSRRRSRVLRAPLRPGAHLSRQKCAVDHRRLHGSRGG